MMDIILRKKLILFLQKRKISALTVQLPKARGC
jgi:hypothetical protein